ncbi:MAG TPA: SDR family oxidoreductase [Trebonia sp.]|jgi:3alpha(or 20beta)-hydroxysteroid dehydrogenase|nr:SDR family oxidoreductase [Trebonia sp.]
MSDLAGQVAIVTGGGSGIGAAVAARLRADGARVVATDIRVPAGVPAGDLVAHDVSSLPSWDALVGGVLASHQRIDVLVNNAGVFRGSGILDTDAQTFEEVLAVNQRGVFFGLQVVGRVMCRQGSGSIINMSSYAGMHGEGSSIAYQTSKWAVRGLSRFAAREFAPHGVRVNAVAPGFIDTPMLRSGPPSLPERVIARTPLARLGDADEVAATIAFLASDESSFITGAELPVDGGILA